MPIPDLRIRRGTPDDAPAIASVRVDTWRSAYRGLVPDALLDGLDGTDINANWRRGLESIDPTRVAVVADVGRRVIGFATGGRPRHEREGYRGEVYALSFLIELVALNGRAKLAGERVHAALQY